MYVATYIVCAYVSRVMKEVTYRLELCDTVNFKVIKCWVYPFNSYICKSPTHLYNITTVTTYVRS